MKALYWTATGLLATLLVVFAISNRSGVTLSLWPLDIVLEAPLYLVVLLMLLTGFLVGLLVAWIWSWGPRRAARIRARRVEDLERELKAAEARLKGGGTALIERD